MQGIMDFSGWEVNMRRHRCLVGALVAVMLAVMSMTGCGGMSGQAGNQVDRPIGYEQPHPGRASP